jgi:hypothetical protein
LKADKDSLESALYEVQEQFRQLEVRKEQLEGENQELYSHPIFSVWTK